MLRIFAPLIFIALFAVWMVYHALIKKDIRQHRDSLYLGLVFTTIWGAVYTYLLA